MTLPSPNRPAKEISRRRKFIYFLTAGVFLLLAVIVSQVSFDLPFLNPGSNQQLAFFAALSILIFLLFVALTVVLGRNLIKLFAERGWGFWARSFARGSLSPACCFRFCPSSSCSFSPTA